MSDGLACRKPLTFRGKQYRTGQWISRKAIIEAVGEGRLDSMIRLGWLTSAPTRHRPNKKEVSQDGSEET